MTFFLLYEYLAAWAFGRLRDKIWSNQNISRTIKVRIYKALILPIAIYGSESWTLRKITQSEECQHQTRTSYRQDHYPRNQQTAIDLVWTCCQDASLPTPMIPIIQL